jgi:hypothetical protein
MAAATAVLGLLAACSSDGPGAEPGSPTSSTVDELTRVAKNCEAVDVSIRGPENLYSAVRVNEAGDYDPSGNRLECHFDIHGDPDERFTCADGTTIYGPLRTSTAIVTLDGDVVRTDPAVVVPEACDR